MMDGFNWLEEFYNVFGILEKLRSSTFKSSCSSGWWWYRGHNNHNADYIELVGRSTVFQSLKGFLKIRMYLYLSNGGGTQDSY